jgi:NAD(P)-dependent dehydrogenase (short-subunit alcohol dehydrogenase family)
MDTLDGKVAVVTGATSGIGERIAELFVEEGAQVIATGRREQEGAALERSLGKKLVFLRADVSKEADVQATFDLVRERFGRLDVLVNNAGQSTPLISIADLDMAIFDNLMNVNIRGLVMCMKYAAKIMLPQRSGSIINIASLAATRGGMTAHPYSASKGAVCAVTRSVAAELGEKGIRVNVISPGAIVTGIFAKNAGVEGSKADKVAGAVRDVFATLQPVPRSGEPDDVARAAVFLASDASGFVNGHELAVDGGITQAARRWSDGLAIRAQLATRIKAAAAL